MTPNGSPERVPDPPLDPPLDPILDRLRQLTPPAGRAGCPAAEQIARLAAGEVSDIERSRLADHLGLCAACGEEWRLARELESWAARAAPSPSVRWGWPRRAPAPRLAWAAALLVVVGAAVALVRLPGRGGDDALRSLPAAGLAHAVAPADGARLLDAPLELAWRRPVAAKVELFDAALLPLGDSGAAVRSPWRLPEPLKGKLRRRGGRIYWRVVVEGEVGAEASALALFELPATP